MVSATRHPPIGDIYSFFLPGIMSRSKMLDLVGKATGRGGEGGRVGNKIGYVGVKVLN